MLVDKKGSNDEDPGLTVENATAFLQHAKGTAPADAQILSKAKMQSLLNRAVPYGKEVQGTEVFFAGERKKLLSIISSPVTTNEGYWSHFFTEAMPDMYLPEVYDNAITSANPIITGHATVPHSDLDARRRSSDELTWSKRAELLRDHPVLAARLHKLQLEAFFNKIVKGRSKPFGEVLDHWIRIEFQGKGTAHSHWLLNTLRHFLDGDTVADLDMDDPDVLARLLELCKRTCTARLQPRNENDKSDLSVDPAEHEYETQEEKKWDSNIKRRHYFDDNSKCHPCRQRFSSDHDYSVDENGVFCDAHVQKKVRRLQLHNNMHTCRSSCFKYCRNGERICRYGFPRAELENNIEDAVLVSDRDMRHRVRHKIHAPRNNGNVNNVPVNPLVCCCLRGNVDIQILTNSGGAVEYTCKYCSKADAAESTTLQNIISKQLSRHVLTLAPHERVTTGKKIRAIINAIVQGQQIGAVHACYVLLQQALVISSRLVENVNTLIRDEIKSQTILTDEGVLSQMDADDSAMSCSPRTTFGRRDAFHAFYLAQEDKHGAVEFDFFAFLTSYTVVNMTPTESPPMDASKLPQLEVDKNGLIRNAKTCCIGLVRTLTIL